MKQTFSQYKFATFDIESTGFDKFLIGGYFDGNNFTHTGQTKDFKNLMELIFEPDSDITVVYAHFGGIFDFIHLIDFLFNESSDVKISDVILQGSKILSMKVYYNKCERHLIDSSGLFPFGLESLTKSFGVKHEKMKLDVTNLTIIDDQLIEYLKNDCVGLWECIYKYSQQEYIKDIPYQITRSGVAFKIFTKFFHEQKYLPKHSKAVKEFTRKAYMGGRTEIFKPLFINKAAASHLKDDKKLMQWLKNNHQLNEGELKAYDVNSLYPSVMRDFDFPGNLLTKTTYFVKTHLGIYDLTVRCPLGLKIPLLGTVIDGKYMFPTGVFRGHFCSPEIHKALELGYEILECHEGMIFENREKIFKEFIEKFYTMRLETNDAVTKIICKDAMNHLYGRMGINEERDQITFYPEAGTKKLSEIKFKDYSIILYSKSQHVHLYSCPALSAFVTSYARLRLYGYFELAGFDNCYYCDTDSLYTTSDLENSLELGKMKLEKRQDAACFLLPKSYNTINTEKVSEIKLKGIPHKSIGHIDFRTFVESIAGEVRLPEFKLNSGLAKIKTAFKKGKIITVLGDRSKKIGAIYDKRIIFQTNRGYETRPRVVQAEE